MRLIFYYGGEIIIFDMFNVLTKKGRMIGSKQSPIIEGCLKWKIFLEGKQVEHFFGNVLMAKRKIR